MSFVVSFDVQNGIVGLCRSIADRYRTQVSTNYRRSVGKVSAKCSRGIGKVSVN